jgi:hypothetical protein
MRGRGRTGGVFTLGDLLFFRLLRLRGRGRTDMVFTLGEPGSVLLFFRLLRLKMRGRGRTGGVFTLDERESGLRFFRLLSLDGGGWFLLSVRPSCGVGGLFEWETYRLFRSRSMSGGRRGGRWVRSGS